MGVGGPSDPQLGGPVRRVLSGCHFWCRPQCRHPSEVHQGSPWPHPPCMGSRRLTGAQAGTHAAARTHTHTSHQTHAAHSVSVLGRVTGILTGLRELSTLPLPASGTYSSVYPSSCPGLASPAPGCPSSCQGTLRDEAFSIPSWAMAGAPPTPPCAALAPLLPGLDPCRSRWAHCPLFGTLLFPWLGLPREEAAEQRRPVFCPLPWLMEGGPLVSWSLPLSHPVLCLLGSGGAGRGSGSSTGAWDLGGKCRSPLWASISLAWTLSAAVSCPGVRAGTPRVSPAWTGSACLPPGRVCSLPDPGLGCHLWMPQGL